MTRIQFTRDTVPLREGGDYKTGQIVELSDASANHWLGRQAAVPYVEPPKAEPKADRPESKADAKTK